jgi:hypothetical protein
MREHPLTGEAVPWSMMRPGHHCGMITGCDNMLLFRSGFTGFMDLSSDNGTQHFAGHRLGCWINAIPADGLVVIPEASVGCVCMFSIASTIVLEPREARQPWFLFSGVGATTPVKHMALNFGAPGDHRDANGKLWLAYPRPVPNPKLETSLDLKLALDCQFGPDGGFFTADGDASARTPAEWAWIASSGARDARRLAIPLRGPNDRPGTYDLRLVFARAEGDRPGERVFDVRVQDELLGRGVDPAADPESREGVLVREFKHVRVADVLVIEVVPRHDPPGELQVPILCGLEVQSAGGE